MAKKYDHLRRKAIQLRVEKHMTLDEICEHLGMPKTTVYYWIKDHDIPRTEKQTEAQKRGTEACQEKFRLLREQAYQQGVEEAPELFKDLHFRDFIVLYLTEGYRKGKNTVQVANSNPQLMKLGYHYIRRFTNRNISFSIQYHEDQDLDELRNFWGNYLDISPKAIRMQRKSNGNQLNGRNWRSVHGVLSIYTYDTYFRAKLQAWMDILESQW